MKDVTHVEKLMLPRCERRRYILNYEGFCQHKMHVIYLYIGLRTVLCEHFKVMSAN